MKLKSSLINTAKYILLILYIALEAVSTLVVPSTLFGSWTFYIARSPDLQIMLDIMYISFCSIPAKWLVRLAYRIATGTDICEAYNF